MILDLVKFTGVTAVLYVEGWLLMRLLQCNLFGNAPGNGYASVRNAWNFAWALPLAAITNVLLVFLYTLVHIPLMLATLGTGHIIIVVILFVFLRMKKNHPAIQPSNQPSSHPMNHLTIQPLSNLTSHKIIKILCMILLTNAFLFSAVHAVVLPSISIDVFTNWTMRSKISWVDQKIAFDRTEARGMAKPQYPFLIHALQVTANAGQHDWSDRVANTITWLLTISSFIAVFLVLQKLRGTFLALCTITGMITIPMMVIHLSAGYGDIHLVTYGLLSFLALAAFLEEQDRSWLFLSSAMTLGALWSKSEGLYFVCIPWMIALILIFLRQSRAGMPALMGGWTLVRSLAAPLVLFLPFLGLLMAKGLPITPHESDGSIGIKWEGFAALPSALFGGGSFGILWYVLPIVIVAILLQNSSARNAQFAPGNGRADTRILLGMGLLSLLAVLFVYLFTPNVGFLLNGQSFYRQMLLPAALLIAWVALAIPHNQKPVTNNQ